MTVKELRERLAELPDDLPVLVYDPTGECIGPFEARHLEPPAEFFYCRISGEYHRQIEPVWCEEYRAEITAEPKRRAVVIR